MNSIADTFRANLVRVRKAAGISQSELARRIGSASSYVCDLERGRDDRSPSLETVGRLADALGVSPADLVADPEKNSAIPA